jgi:hypothetical protein
MQRTTSESEFNISSGFTQSWSHVESATGRSSRPASSTCRSSTGLSSCCRTRWQRLQDEIPSKPAPHAAISPPLRTKPSIPDTMQCIPTTRAPIPTSMSLRGNRAEVLVNELASSTSLFICVILICGDWSPGAVSDGPMMPEGHDRSNWIHKRRRNIRRTFGSVQPRSRFFCRRFQDRMEPARPHPTSFRITSTPCRSGGTLRCPSPLSR